MSDQFDDVTRTEADAVMTPGNAEWFEAVAEQKRRSAGATAAPWAAQQRAEADGLEMAARRLRDPVSYGALDLHHGCGGEVMPRVELDAPGKVRDVASTVRQSPDMLAADATLDRLTLARDANVLVTAVEVAQDVGATKAGEKMLAHQIAAAHRTTMGLFATADSELYKHRVAANVNPGALTESIRCANSASRVMSASIQGTLVLDRLRTGGRQTITVQHVTVADEGRVVVAGNMTTPEPSR